MTIECDECYQINCVCDYGKRGMVNKLTKVTNILKMSLLYVQKIVPEEPVLISMFQIKISTNID